MWEGYTIHLKDDTLRHPHVLFINRYVPSKLSGREAQLLYPDGCAEAVKIAFTDHYDFIYLESIPKYIYDQDLRQAPEKTKVIVHDMFK